ncbi:16S rRNA (cytidine(1402)-2'-O)-methyltransferase [Arcticibacterium luteifluviistationis]|uniref:Ribosomal RNA small subunit methyltransferase I n=1 Tax=Arcticibacterium luteifluviistationis TaxID=1784714 RepID=A0A2Z4G6Z9_9BACT|nr:16S rRNA (cytidine(1402)-2'-O)-methyltransferase [Arcticibacterium luteifluviistationis]AWV96853.1 16S rRNA (cytidine(1402)-2'-O)-methyltransferase [Arcticibacterium luteifluviistationis]
MPLKIVPTPIGNLDDITLRAIKVLEGSDLILAEDTRKSGILLKHLEIKRPMQSFHIFNEHKQLDNVIKMLKEERVISLISDAGTPAISDPGFLLVRACIENEIIVECLPGATAFVPALVNSGLPSDSFVFEGFLPPKKGRKTKLESLAEESRTMIFYESPHRLLKALNEFIALFGSDRRACVSRELTKIHEENVRGTLSEILANFADRSIKGEIVIIVEGLNRKKSK